jgi:hypothetical protein
VIVAIAINSVSEVTPHPGDELGFFVVVVVFSILVHS